MEESKLTASIVFLRTPFYPASQFWKKQFEVTDFKKAEFLEALYIASPDLYQKFVKEPASNVDEDDSLRSVYKYYLRMSYRSTPFGMFSGVSLGKTCNKTDIILKGHESYRKHTRLDNHFLSTYIQHVLQQQEVRNAVTWFANNTIYEVKNKLRFVEYRLEKNQRSYHLSNVEASGYLQLILSGAKDGAKIKELIDSIQSEEVTEEEASAFVLDIIESKLLLSELEPGVTGEEPHLKVIRVLEHYDATRPHAEYLKMLTNKLKNIDDQSTGAMVSLYREVVDDIHSFDKDYDEKLIFQSDLIKPTTNFSLGVNVLEELKKGISFLTGIKRSPENPSLKKFKEEFSKRYEEAEVSLLAVLDSESGIGYPIDQNNDNAPFLKGLYFNGTKADTQYAVTEWSKKLIELYKECIRTKRQEVVITENDIISFSDQDELEQLPGSFITFCTILASSGAEVDNGNFELLYKGTNGPSAASLLGRFCHSDKAITEAVMDLIAKEEALDKDKIYAEIVHLAQARVGNILIRPNLRQYEIPILTFSGVDEQHTIPLSDLMVSVRNNRVVLRSKSKNKEIIPRNTTAHNFANDSLPYYHFLCDLQFQYARNSAHWDWGILNEFSFLPRVKYGKIIFAAARWIIDLDQLNLSKAFKEEEFKIAFLKYASLNHIPEQVIISQSDNQLPLHLGNEMCLKILLQEFKRNKQITLEECLFNDNNLLVEGPEGKFTNEFIIPWTRTLAKENVKIDQTKVHNETSVQRTFIPGSSWHYVKIYCGVKTADQILTEAVQPLTEKMLAEGIIDKWFFIRYADPDHHLRIRFKGSGSFHAVLMDKLNRLLEPHLEGNLIWKIQADTYQRELERYGPENIENSESLFYYDSTATLKIISLLDGDEGEGLRWQFAIKGVHDLLNSFGLDLLAKRDFVATLSKGFLKEFNMDNVEAKRQLGTKYRGIKLKIHEMLQDELDSTHEFYEVWEIFAERYNRIAECVARINDLASQNELTLDKSSLLASYIHMFLNRFFRSKQRMQEMVIYDLLHQHYRSQVARKSKVASMNLEQLDK